MEWVGFGIGVWFSTWSMCLPSQWTQVDVLYVTLDMERNVR